MLHETQIRKVPESRSIVLLVHGILGTPHQFDPFVSAIPENISMINLLLDGHGGTVENFGRSSMSKWEAQVSSLVNSLCTEYENVFIIAHSMGTLFALDAAITHPDKIKGLILLSPPLKVGPKLRLIRYAFRIGLGFGGSFDAELASVQHAYSLETDRCLWKYRRWVARYLELFSKIRHTRAQLSKLITPTTVYLCLNDEMVSIHSDFYVKNHPACKLYYLSGSSHFAYNEEDAEHIRDTIQKLLK